MTDKEKHDVYQYEHNGSKTLFSRGVKREFGENRVVFVDGHQVLSSVMPLQDAGGLELIGYLYA